MGLQFVFGLGTPQSALTIPLCPRAPTQHSADYSIIANLGQGRALAACDEQARQCAAGLTSPSLCAIFSRDLSHVLQCKARQASRYAMASHSAAQSRDLTVSDQGSMMSASQGLFACAQKVLPGGVSASARVHPVIGHPFYVSRGKGPCVYNLDGREYIDRSGLPIQLQYVGPRFGIHFGLEQPVTNYRRAATQDRQALLQFIVGCVKRGLYVHVSPHRSFSAVHTQADLDRALNAIKGALSNLRRTWLA